MNPNVNLSDHCSDLNLYVTGKESDNANCSSTRCIPQLCWDHAKLDLYRNITDVLLRLLFDDVR